MAAYGQRTDLNMAPTAVPGQTYGKAGAQIAAQRAVPMGAQAAPAAPKAPTSTPGQYGPLDRPTERPNEPVTAGAPFGPGRMGEQTAYAGPVGGDSVLDELRALYAKFPNNDLADMIDSYIREGY
jgi:hypothetical protein